MKVLWGVGRLVVLASCWGLTLGCGDDAHDKPSASAGASGASGTSGLSGNGGTPAAAGSSNDTGGVSDAGSPSTDPCDCDDGVACTLDTCTDGKCAHQPLHFECPADQYCSSTDGCSDGAACAEDADCKRPDACLTVHCDKASARCKYAFLDGDSDGKAPLSCGGNDCNDADKAVNGDEAEICDGKDNDCDGENDPPAASACLGGLVCLESLCRCPPPMLGCQTQPGVATCIDPTNDPAHCGGCDTVCADTEQCVDGACKCAAGNKVCGNTCVNLKTDISNCGKCGTICGNAECVDGACTCPEDSVDCSETNVPVCRATGTDVLNCGSCGYRCLDAGACDSGACDTSIEWLRIYSAYVTPYYGQGEAKIESDAAGNIFFTGTADSGAYKLFPNGNATLWTGPGVIAKFDASGALKWAKNASTGLWQMAVVGGDVWVSVYEIVKDSITVAGHTFNRKANYQAFTAVLKLDAETGDVADYFQLDYATWQGGSDPFLLHDASHVWLVQAHNVAPELGDVTWTPGSASYNTFVYPLGAAGPVWFKGYLQAATTDANGKPILEMAEDPNTTVNFGGQDLVFGAQGGGVLLRLTTQLAHDTSFSMFGTGSLVKQAPTLLDIGGYGAPILSSLTEAGDLTLVATSTAFTPYRAQSTPGHVLMNGYTNGGTLAGRSVPLNAQAFVAYSDTTYMLERALAFYANGQGGTHGGILGFTPVDGGTSVVLAVRLQNGMLLNGQQYDIGTGADAVALLKVKLYQP